MKGLQICMFRQCSTSSNFVFTCKSRKCPTSNFYIVEFEINQLLLEVKWLLLIQARIAQFVVYRLGTGEVLGSNPDMGDNFSVKIRNWIVRIWIWICWCDRLGQVSQPVRACKPGLGELPSLTSPVATLRYKFYLNQVLSWGSPRPPRSPRSPRSPRPPGLAKNSRNT